MKIEAHWFSHLSLSDLFYERYEWGHNLSKHLDLKTWSILEIFHCGNSTTIVLFPVSQEKLVELAEIGKIKIKIKCGRIGVFRVPVLDLITIAKSDNSFTCASNENIPRDAFSSMPHFKELNLNTTESLIYKTLFSFDAFPHFLNSEETDSLKFMFCINLTRQIVSCSFFYAWKYFEKLDIFY